MIKQIKKLKEFGSFRDFNASRELDDFLKYNLIYAYNGAGKTTLSRFLDILGNTKEIPDFLKQDGYNEDFELLLDDNSTISKFSAFNEKIKVFNVDFIKEQLRFDENNISPIKVEIGKEVKDIKDKIIKIRDKYIKGLYYINEKNEVSDKLIFEKINEKYIGVKEKICRDYATKVRIALNLNQSSYRCDKFETACCNFSGVDLISMEEKEKLCKQYIENSSKQKIEYDCSQSFITQKDLDYLTVLLKDAVMRGESKYKDEILNWIEKGKNFDISENKNLCYFCGSPINDWNNLILEIEKLLKKDISYEILEKKLNEFLLKIENEQKYTLGNMHIKNKLQNDIRKEDFLVEFQDEAKKILDNITSENSQYNALLYKIENIIKDKQKKMSESLTLDREIELSKLAENVLLLDNLISKNNDKIDLIEDDKKEFKSKVINYYVSLKYRTINNLNKKIEYNQEIIEKIKQAVTINNDKICRLEKKLNNQTEAINMIQEYIKIIFTKQRFKFEYDGISKSYFIIDENGRNAKNLSEGEKTVIAFAYFLVTLIESNFELKESIVVIDDPISSLDQNYLFNLICLITRKFYNEDTFNQIFILTHNFYFFKKLKTIWDYKNKSDADKKFRIFEINKNSNTSEITRANKGLKGFNSDYLNSIGDLKNEYNTIVDNETKISIGVAIRKVFEVFLSYHFPYEGSITSKFRECYKNDSLQSYNYLEGIANASCHTDEIDSLEVQDCFKLEVGKVEIKQLFDFIHEVDPKHHAALKLPK